MEGIRGYSTILNTPVVKAVDDEILVLPFISTELLTYYDLKKITNIRTQYKDFPEIWPYLSSDFLQCAFYLEPGLTYPSVRLIEKIETLKKKIETQTVEGVCEPIFDFCFIDGSKNWTIDGFAFFLVDKLLRESGTILFDDYGWSYSEHNDKQVTDGISHREMSEDQLHSPNIKLVFQLLVMQHPNYSNFQIDDESWAWARKIRSDVKTLTLHTKPSFKRFRPIILSEKKFLE